MAYSIDKHDEFRRNEPIGSATSFRHLSEIVHAIEPDAGWQFGNVAGPRVELLRDGVSWAVCTFDELKAKLAAHYASREEATAKGCVS